MGKTAHDAVELARDFKKKARKGYGIQKIVLFGSQATGKAREGSDIDLLMVSNRCGKKAAFMSKLLAEWHVVQGKRHPVDFICFTKREFEGLAKRITIVSQALKEGIEIS